MKKRHFVLKSFAAAMICAASLLSFPTSAKAAEAPKPVSVRYVNYEEAYLLIDPANNTKVYYSDSKQSVWNEVEGEKTAGGYLKLDISWMSTTADYELNLKGVIHTTDEEEDAKEDIEIVTVTLPEKNNDLKVTFDKLSGKLEFTNEGAAETFVWRKSTSYEWSDPVAIAQNDKAFLAELEALRIKGGKIVVKIEGKNGVLKADGSFDAGSRQSKEVTVNITKRAAAPKVAVDVNKLLLSTKTTMEYRIYAIDGVKQSGDTWKAASLKMALGKVAPNVLYTATSKAKESVTVAFRTAATDKMPYSQVQYLNIPVQKATGEIAMIGISNGKYKFSFPDASKTKVVQYTVVKAGNTFDPVTAVWKNMTSAKEITLSEKNVASGSKIYVRFKGTAATSKLSLVLPTHYYIYDVKY
ncbi:MAG: hypothetical protein E7256_14460 [Lachnospiraceae bacterium]|nr:hypothetical protein [Lachnospiraceae bacterium]